MTTQTLNISLFDSLNIGNVGVGHSDPVPPAYQGDVDNSAGANEGSFDEALNRRIAQDEVTTPNERASESNERPASSQEDPSSGPDSDALPVRQGPSAAEPPKQASGKPLEKKGNRKAQSETVSPETTGAELLPVDLASLVKTQTVTQGTPETATDKNLAGKAKHSQSDPRPTDIASGTAQNRPGSVATGAHGVLSQRHVKDLETASLLEKGLEGGNTLRVAPTQAESDKSQDPAAAFQVRGLEGELAGGARIGNQQITDAQQGLKPPAQEAEANQQITDSQQGLKPPAQEAEAEQQPATGPLPGSALNNAQVTQSENMPKQATVANASPSQHAVQGDGFEKMIRDSEKKNADASVLSASQRRDADRDAQYEQALNSPRATKQVLRSASSKIPSGSMLSGAVVSKTSSPVMSNEGQSTSAVDHAVPSNSQGSIFDVDISNQADVRSPTSFAATAIPKGASASISGQILESIHSSLQQGQSRLTIALNPPELGRVSVHFEEQDNQLIGILEVSQKQTRAEIEQALPQLLQNLQDSGVQIKRLDVMLNDQPEHGHSKDQPWNDASDAHSDQQNQEGREGRSGSDTGYDYDQPALEANRAAFFESDEATSVGNSAIDMLA